MWSRLGMGTLRIVLVLLALHVLLLSAAAAFDYTVVKFPDPNLESVVREAIRKPVGDIYAGEMGNIAQITAKSRGVANITGLEHAVNLAVLDLEDNEIADIGPLSGLPGLM